MPAPAVMPKPNGVGSAIPRVSVVRCVQRACALNFPSLQGTSESFKMSIALAIREARPASGLILLTMSLGVLIAQIDTCVVNLAVKPIGTDLKASVTELQWLVDVYNCVYVSVRPTTVTW